MQWRLASDSGADVHRTDKKHLTGTPFLSQIDSLAGLARVDDCAATAVIQRAPIRLRERPETASASRRLSLAGLSPDVSMSHENTGHAPPSEPFTRRYRIDLAMDIDHGADNPGYSLAAESEQTQLTATSKVPSGGQG